MTKRHSQSDVQARRALLAIVAALALAAWLTLPSSAHALRIWSEGTAERPLSVDALEGVAVGSVRGAPGAALERSILWEYAPPGDEYFEPFSVQSLLNGNVLVASRSNEILEVTRGKRIVWSYTRLSDNPDLVNAYSAQRLPNGNTLITDRRADFVIEVTPDKQTIWQYGAYANSTDAGCLMDPFSAVRLPNGNTLITDNRFGTRVIEVRSSDYDPAQPNLGYTDESIVWQYGATGVGGIAPGQLASPRAAQRLPNGNTLIVDSADQVLAGHRVIEVTPTGEIAWQFGTAGVAGSDATHLSKPSSAQRLTNGNTVIAEEEGGRILEVDQLGQLVEVYGPGEIYPENGTFGNVRSLERLPSGTTLVADQGDQRVAEFGYALSGTLTSKPLSLGLPGVQKTIQSIEAIVEAPEGTSVSISYALDDGPWKSGGTAINLPAGSTARFLRYRLTLNSNSAAYTSVVREVRVAYEVTPSNPKKPGGTGTSGGRTRGGYSSGVPWGTGTGSSTGGTKQGGSGYTTGGTTATDSGMDGATSAQQGWSMASTTYTAGASGGASSAPQAELGGLLALGVVYVVGAASVPLGTIVSGLRHRPTLTV